MAWLWIDWKVTIMLSFIAGLALGFLVGYPLGLWAIDYTRKFNEREKHSRTNK